ncbi:MAG: hypothetical protein ACKPKO_57245, partial [Candidatus Fonsibacter sp.]
LHWLLHQDLHPTLKVWDAIQEAYTVVASHTASVEAKGVVQEGLREHQAGYEEALARGTERAKEEG